MQRRVLAAMVLVLGFEARADRREIYTMVAIEPGVASAHAPVQPPGTSSHVACGAQLAAFYGVTNSIHVGAALSFNYAPNFRYGNVSRRLEDGSSTPVGTYFQNGMTVGLGALAQYRFDTGFALAPIARLEVGLNFAQLVGAQLQPDGRDFGIDFAAEGRAVFAARGLVGVEWRVSERWVGSVGIGYRRNFGGSVPWEISVPLGIGLVW